MDDESENASAPEGYLPVIFNAASGRRSSSSEIFAAASLMVFMPGQEGLIANSRCARMEMPEARDRGESWRRKKIHKQDGNTKWGF